MLAGDSGSGGSIPSSATGNSDETNSVDEHSMMMAAMNNNNNLDNGMSEICDVPDHVANQKRHVSSPALPGHQLMYTNEFGRAREQEIY